MPEIKTYIGTKIVQGSPMTRLVFHNIHKKGPFTDRDQPGYRVTYPDNYISWSPKKVFENAYREVTKEEAEFF